MQHSGHSVAVLDANVLYSAPVRDILLSLAREKLFQPKWTDKINQEWSVNLKKNRPDIDSIAIRNTNHQMGKAFPDANISGYESWIEQLTLPDEDDRHVLAAAIRGKADVIVTFNLGDFPIKSLKEFDIEPVHPDDFIIHLIDLDEQTAFRAFKKMVARLKHPPLSETDVLKTLEKCGLKKTVKRISQRT